MRLSGTRLARGITLILSLAVLAAGWWTVAGYRKAVLARLGPTLLAQAQQSLKREIRVDRMVYDRPGLLLAEGVRVAHGPSLAEGELLRARRIEIRYNPALVGLSSLLSRAAGIDARATVVVDGIVVHERGPYARPPFLTAERLRTAFDLSPLLHKTGDVLSTVEDVEVVHPHVRLVRDARRRWNFEDLFPTREKRKPTTFRGRLHTADGTVDLTDYISGGHPAPVRSRARARATASFAGFPVIHYQAAGRVLGPHGGPVTAEGFRDTGSGHWFASLDASGSDLPHWLRYVSRPDSPLRLESAQGRVRGAVWGERVGGRPVQYAIDAEVRRGAGAYAGYPEKIRGFTGAVHAEPGLVTLKGSAEAAGAPIRVEARVLPLVPRVRARLSSGTATISGIRRLLPGFQLAREVRTSGTFPVEASLEFAGGVWAFDGRAALPTAVYRKAVVTGLDVRFHGHVQRGGEAEVAGSGTADRVRFLGYDGTGVRASYTLRKGILEADATFGLLGGQVRGSGWTTLDPEAPRLYLTGSADRLSVAKVFGARTRWKLAGAAHTDFVVSGTPDDPVFTGYVSTSGLVVDGQPIDEVAGRVRKAGGLLTIPYGVVRLAGAEAAVSGTVTDAGDVDLVASASRLDLAAFLSSRMKEPVAGLAYVSGHITGTTESPQVEGRLQVYHPAYRDLRGDYFETAFQAREVNDVQLSRVKLDRLPETATAAGLRLFRDVEVDAPWKVAGEVSVAGASVARLLVLAGMARNPEEDPVLVGDLEPIRLRLSGDVERPTVHAELASPRLLLAGYDLGRVSAAARLDLAGKTVTLEEARAEGPEGRARLSGAIAYDPDAKPEERARRLALSLQGALEGIGLPGVVRDFAPDLLDYVDLRGELARAEFSIVGSAAQPQVEARVELAGVVANGRAVEVAPITVSANREVAVIRDVEAKLGGGTVRLPVLVALPDRRAAGARLSQWLAGSADVKAVSLAALLQLLEDSPYYTTRAAARLREAIEQWRAPVGGRLDLKVAFGPELPAGEAPADLAARVAANQGASLTASLEIPDLASPPIAGRPATHVAGAFAYDGRRLDVRRLVMEKGGQTLLSASGSYGEGAVGSQLDVRVQGVRVSSVLRLPIAGFRERVEGYEPLDGVVSLAATVSGTLRSPEIRFEGRVTEPLFEGVPLQALAFRGDYSGSASRLHLDEARLTTPPTPAGTEGSVTLSGDLPARWPTLQSPGDAERKLVLEVPSQPLAVLHALAARADEAASARSAEAAGRIRPLTDLFRELAATEGKMQGRFTLGGTAAAPHNSGYLELADGTLHVDGFQTTLQEFNARIDLEGDRLRVTRFGGKSSLGGTFTGGGEIVLARDEEGAPAPRLALTLALDQFRFAEKKVGNLVGEGQRGAPFRGTLQTVEAARSGAPAPVRITGQWPTPRVEGAIQLDDASLALGFEAPAAESAAAFPGDVRLDLKLLAGRSVWLRNPLVRLKVDGELATTGAVNAPVVGGELRASRGEFTLPTLRLQNVEGAIRIAYDARLNDLAAPAQSPVYVDLHAATTMALQRSALGETEDFEVTFRIQGHPGGGSAPASEAFRPTNLTGGLTVGGDQGLRLTVRTDPPLPQDRIVALIRQRLGVEGFGPGGTNVVETLRGQFEQAFAVTVGAAITSPIEQALRSALGLNVMSIEVGAAMAPRIRIGRRLFGPLYGTVTQDFSSPEGQQRQFELYYRINPRLRVGVRQEEPIRRRIFFFSGAWSF